MTEEKKVPDVVFMPNQPKPAELTKKLLKVKEIKNLPKDFEEVVSHFVVEIPHNVKWTYLTLEFFLLGYNIL